MIFSIKIYWLDVGVTSIQLYKKYVNKVGMNLDTIITLHTYCTICKAEF